MSNYKSDVKDAAPELYNDFAIDVINLFHKKFAGTMVEYQTLLRKILVMYMSLVRADLIRKGEDHKLSSKDCAMYAAIYTDQIGEELAKLGIAQPVLESDKRYE